MAYINGNKTYFSVVSEIVDGGIIPSGTKTITENGTHDVTNYASVAVNVESSDSSSNTFVIPAGTYSPKGASASPWMTPSFHSILPEGYTASANISGNTYCNNVGSEVTFDNIEMYYKYESMRLGFYSGDEYLGHHHLYDGMYPDITISNDAEVGSLFYLIFMDMYSANVLPETFKANYFVSGNAQQMGFALAGQFDLTNVNYGDAGWYENGGTDVSFAIYAIDTDGTIYDGEPVTLVVRDGHLTMRIVDSGKAILTDNYVEGRSSTIKDDIISFGANYQSFPNATELYYVLEPHAVIVS